MLIQMPATAEQGGKYFGDDVFQHCFGSISPPFALRKTVWFVLRSRRRSGVCQLEFPQTSCAEIYSHRPSAGLVLMIAQEEIAKDFI